MALLTRRECYCRQPYGEPGSTCWTCQGRVQRSSGSDDHSYQVKGTYTESYGDAFGAAYEEGKDSFALAMPGAYSRSTTFTGRDWFETMAWGGSSAGSFAYAGPDGLDARAGSGGHAISVRGSGSGFEAMLEGPGGKVIQRLSNGSIRRSKRTKTDEKYRRTKYRDEINRIDDYDDNELVPIKDRDETRKAIEYNEKKQKGVKHGNNSRRVIMWEA